MRINRRHVLALVAALSIAVWILYPRDFVVFRVILEKPAGHGGRLSIPIPEHKGDPDLSIIDAVAKQILASGDAVEITPESINIEVAKSGQKRSWSGSIEVSDGIDCASKPAIELAGAFKTINGQKNKYVHVKTKEFAGRVRLKIILLTQQRGIFGGIENRETVEVNNNGAGNLLVICKRTKAIVH